MQIAPTSTSIQFENQSWLGNDRAHNPQSCTLRTAAFTANTHYPKGYLPSGLEIAQYTSGGFAGLWGPFDKTATDGRQSNVCYLYTSQRVRDASTDIVGAVLEGGQPVIITSKLPIATTLTTTEQANSTRFTYHTN